MILDCPTCIEPFNLSSKCFQSNGRIDIKDGIICPLCEVLHHCVDIVDVGKWKELCQWINEYNISLITTDDKRKVWEIIVYDRALRNQLIDESQLPFAAGDPSMRILIRSEKPDDLFILKKFREYTMKEFRHGFYDPVINVHLAVRVMDHEAVIDA